VIPRILIVIPSKDNPESARMTFESFKKHTVGHTDMMMYIDRGVDPYSGEIPYKPGSFESYGDAIKKCIGEIPIEYQHYLLGCDQMRFERGWELVAKQLLSIIPDTGIIVGEKHYAPIVSGARLKELEISGLSREDCWQKICKDHDLFLIKGIHEFCP